MPQAHVRPVEEMLQDDHGARCAAAAARREPAGERQVGVCRHFTLLHVAMLRQQGVPARARCGFAAYFRKAKYVDHWVTEYWNERPQRLGAVRRAARCPISARSSGSPFDPVDVPRDQFLVAGDCWQLCRAGKADPMDFGILDLFGWWFIAGNVVRDIAALNNHEMLPWDVLGTDVRHRRRGRTSRLFDRLAALSHAPDAHFDELRAIYAPAPGVPPTGLQRRPQPCRNRLKGEDHASPQDRFREEWLDARRALLAKEKAADARRTRWRAEARELPWVKVDKDYVFDGPNGKETLADLFAGRSQLIVKHFMLGPDWKQGCLGCSFGADQIDGQLVHLINHDVMFVAVSRAPYPEIAAFQKRMGWHFKWVSSFGSDFNFDYHVSFTEEDKARGKVFYNFEIDGLHERRAAGLQRVRQGRSGRDFPHLFGVLRAAPTSSAASTASSTSRPRAATSRPAAI